ncbi:DUF262 domain-containing protein [uncultured Microbacterium sp.]|uniref:DUF262 domain-containing protein n=1 Tax=uncultured Microbacterium sp. TaxID=191216 RepID=UPI0026199287|nr:DUF262 domain-containing protein [uncultured Microbacterium sp.]
MTDPSLAAGIVTVEPVDRVVPVSELVRRRVSDTDRWNLALVQRDEVWDSVRMMHLLDSLLAGYPIGAILLSTVAEGTRELAYGEGQNIRVPRDARAGSWQVLDGQQRINALLCLFTDQGGYGTFFLDVFLERPAPAPALGRRRRTRALPHIAHRPPLSTDETEMAGVQDEAEDAFEQQRERLIDLSRWNSWVADHPDLTVVDVSESTIDDVLTSIDPQVRPAESDQERAIATKNLRRLLCAWSEPSVPVLTAELETPLDVLEVFTRINLGGVQMARSDVYFAGVKTFWDDAERHIDAMLRDAPMLRDRLGALRFLSRLAGRGLGHGDALPLSVDRLTGKRGALLREAMQALSADGSTVRTRVAAFSGWYLENSSLGYGINRIASELWDDVLAWVAASDDGGEALWQRNLDAIDSYVLGATLFRYRTIIRDAFRTVSFLEALDAGSRGADFPIDQIVEATRGKTKLAGTRGRSVRGLQTEADRYAVASADAELLTVLAQRIPYSASGFDWDHIYPQAKTSRMSAPGVGGRRRHHKYRHKVGAPGNLWALPASANRALQDTSGLAKFERLEQWMSESAGERVWERARWSISEEEVAKFISVDRLLDDKKTIDTAMEIFAKLVDSRTLRMLDEAFARFPNAKKFAAAEDAPASVPTASRADYRAALALTVGDPLMRDWEPSDAKQRLKERVRDLVVPITEALGDLPVDTWTYAGTGTHAASHVLVAMPGGRGIELMLTWTRKDGTIVAAKAYPNDKYRSGKHLYPDFAEISIGCSWTDPDAEIVARFVETVSALEAAHPAVADTAEE